MMDRNKLKLAVFGVFLMLFLGLPSIGNFDVPMFTSTEYALNHLNPTQVSAENKQNAVPTSDANPRDFRPTNSNYHSQWNHNVMNIGQAWEDGYTGKGVTIAILDTGFYHRHEDINMVGGYSVFPDDPWSNDHSGHGTHIAGIIGARPGTSYQGIAPGADLYGIKIYNSNLADENGVTTDVTSVIRGIRHAVDIEADIIVISSGLSYHDAELHQIIKEAHSEDILIIAASGNGNPAINYPAAYSEVVAITAIDEELNPARDIVYGQENEFTAPGVAIGGLSIPSSPYGYPYIFMSGSSQAVPHAAGLAAIYIEKYGVSGEAVRQIMKEQAVNIGDEGLYGDGLLRYESEGQVVAEMVEPAESDEADEISINDDNVEEDHSVQKPTSSREATDEESDPEIDATSFYQVNIILRHDQGVIAEDTLAYVEDGGAIEVNLDNINSLELTEEQVRDIRDRNISVIIIKNNVSWTIPPSNFLPGNIVFRFFEGTPTGVEARAGQATDIYTLSIYQADKRSNSYPGWMDVRFNISHLDDTLIQNLVPYYWNKKTDEWEKLRNSEISEESAKLRTRYTSAVGFFDSRSLAEEPEEVVPEPEVPDKSDTSTSMVSLTIGVLLISFLLVGLIIRRK